MDTGHHLLDRLAGTHRGRTFFYPLLSSVIILAVVGIGLRLCHSPSPSAERCIGIAGLLLAGLTFFMILRITRRNLRLTATKIDSALGSHNQLETLVELKDSSHPLRAPQAECAVRDAKEFKSAPWPIIFGISGLILCVELCGFTQHIFPSENKSSLPLPKYTKEVIAPEKEPEFAELELTKPESEIRMKPMDEVAWEGNGNSSNGFTELHLAVYLNGEPVADMPVDNPPLKQSGENALSGSFFLDEIDAEPFDLVSYHLVGRATLNGEENIEVVSIPRFIEVRPFREDTQKMGGSGMPDPQVNVLNFIHKVLEFELALNKAVFAARIAGFPQDDPDFIQQISLLKQDQQLLTQELNTFLASVDPQLLSANMLSSLRAAEAHMEAAGNQLAEITGSASAER